MRGFHPRSMDGPSPQSPESTRLGGLRHRLSLVSARAGLSARSPNGEFTADPHTPPAAVARRRAATVQPAEGAVSGAPVIDILGCHGRGGCPQRPRRPRVMTGAYTSVARTPDRVEAVVGRANCDGPARGRAHVQPPRRGHAEVPRADRGSNP